MKHRPPPWRPWQELLAVLFLVLLCAVYFIWSGLAQLGAPPH